MLAAQNNNFFLFFILHSSFFIVFGRAASPLRGLRRAIRSITLCALRARARASLAPTGGSAAIPLAKKKHNQNKFDCAFFSRVAPLPAKWFKIFLADVTVISIDAFQCSSTCKMV